MSLRTFHIVFVGTCVVLALVVAGWVVTSGEGVMRFVWAGLAIAAAAGFIVYGRAFLSKIMPRTGNEH